MKTCSILVLVIDNLNETNLSFFYVDKFTFAFKMGTGISTSVHTVNNIIVKPSSASKIFSLSHILTNTKQS